MQSAKKVYETLLGDGAETEALAHIQVRKLLLFEYNAFINMVVLGILF